MDQHELELFQSNPPLKTENLHCYNDPDHRLTIVAYSGELTPAVTSQAYAWLSRGKPELLKLLRGSIFDFRKVNVFNTGNLSTIQRKSRELNAEIQEYQIPVAMLVSNLYQEKMVYISSRITPEESRKRIVKSVDAALAFFEEYNKKWGKDMDNAGSSALLIES